MPRRRPRSLLPLAAGLVAVGLTATALPSASAQPTASSQPARPARHHKPAATTISATDPRDDVTRAGAQARYFRSSINLTRVVVAHRKRQLGVGLYLDDLKPLNDGSTHYAQQVYVKITARHLPTEGILVQRSGIRSQDYAGIIEGNDSTLVRCQTTTSVTASTKTSTALIVLPLGCLRLGSVPLKSVHFTVKTLGEQTFSDGTPATSDQVAGADSSRRLTGLT